MTLSAARLDADQITGLSGLDYVTALAEGRALPPPMNDVIPFELLPPASGEVRLRARPEARFHNPMGIVHGGWLMTLDPGEICPTHETSVKFLRPVTTASGPIHVIGRILSRGRNLIALEGKAESGGGVLHAHGTSSCVILRKSLR